LTYTLKKAVKFQEQDRRENFFGGGGNQKGIGRTSVKRPRRARRRGVTGAEGVVIEEELGGGKYEGQGTNDLRGRASTNTTLREIDKKSPQKGRTPI